METTEEKANKYLKGANFQNLFISTSPYHTDCIDTTWYYLSVNGRINLMW